MVLFVFSLNMFGLFEFKAPGGKYIGNIQTKSGLLGDFLNGIFATILATPCTAPFLGTALAFAFTASWYVTIYMFLMIGIGLAFPFIITGIFPQTISFLPAPGAWMDHLKKFLALALVLTAIWLLDVFLALTNDTTLLKLNIVLATIFFAIFLAVKITKNKVITLLFFMIPIYILVNMYITVDETKYLKTSDNYIDSHKNSWEPWSKDKMLEYSEAGDLVFMDFTAKWCFTCKANKKLVLNTNDFSKLVKKYNLKLLIGDWTKKDPVIGKWLESQGVVGVPAYFIQTRKGEIISLGEIISIQKIEHKLEEVTKD